MRTLTFPLVMALIMRKGMKSLQNLVNEALDWLGAPGVSASAFSQARYRLKHTAFIELNQKAVVETLYADGEYRRYRGYRLLGIDGSKVLLPDSETVRQEFGTIAYSNGKDGAIEGERPYALASVLYDLRNRVALDARLGRAEAYEVDLAVAHLTSAGPGDLVVADRNYPSFRMLAELSRRGIDFVIRCSNSSFSPARAMLADRGPESQIVTLTPADGKVGATREAGLPTRLRVRFVRVRLSTGENEVLVTSLLDETAWPTADFLDLYHQRWGVETWSWRTSAVSARRRSARTSSPPSISAGWSRCSPRTRRIGSTPSPPAMHSRSTAPSPSMPSSTTPSRSYSATATPRRSASG